MFEEEPSLRTDVVHAPVTGPRGPRRGDLAWLDRDPERECWLDRAREHDEPHEPEEEFEDYAPLTHDELAEISEAAADELLAVEAAALGPARPGPARLGPGVPRRVVQPCGRVRTGMALDVLPGCAQLAVAADAAAGDDGFAAVSEAELVGIMCAWDRVEAHAAARKLAAVAELSRRNPGPGTRSSPRTRSRTRWGSPGSAPMS